jgi:PAS domain S-box-containing protein
MAGKVTYEYLEHRVKELENEAVQHRKTEELLIESEKYWRDVIENAPSFIAITDRDGTLRYVNRTMPGIITEEVIGRNISDFEAPEYSDLSRQAIEQVFLLGKKGSYQIKGFGPEGSHSWYEIFYGPIQRNGQVVAVTFIAIDITERKQAEEALNKAYGELELRVEKRAADLVKANEKLQNEMQERSRLEKALMQKEKLKTLGAIAAEVAHEIRNPLVAIGGFAQRLKKKFPDLPECDIILSESERLERILSRIRSYLEPVEINPQACSISSIITDCLHLLSPETKKRQVKCDLDLAPNMPDVYIDPEILAQIIINLIRNATGALDEGGTLLIKSSESDQDLHIEFKNHAPGLEIEDPETLFMPFAEGGRNIGLPLCYRLLKDMGGLLSFVEEDGCIVFKVSLPKSIKASPDKRRFEKG